METLNIEYTDIQEKSLTARMPVNSKVHQPEGILHGGAMVALAESVGGAACAALLDSKSHFFRGIEISANHVKSLKDGYVHATAQLIHKGKTIQLWDIKLTNDKGQLVSAVKLTTIAIAKK